MLRSFLTITFRILWRNKVTSFVNIFSLSVGMAAFIFIMLYVHYEVSYDKFNVYPHGWTGEITGWLSTPSIQGLAHAPVTGSVDIGIQKTLGPKFKAKLSLQDVFHSNRYKGKINVPSFTSDYTLRFDTRVIMLNLTYAFGNQKLKAARQRRLGSEDESQRAN